MLLSDFLRDNISVPASADRDIKRITLDSRTVGKNELFIALKGTQQHGRSYIADAMARGAAAILVEAESSEELTDWSQAIPQISVWHLKNKLGELASRFYASPARTLRMIGVTGTNGKTSCTHFIAQILEQLKIRCGIIGTLGSGFYNKLGEVGLTTPDAITLQATLHNLLDQGANAIAMEVSSHSIDQGRANGIPFEIGIFTNLTQDHLDYHGDMETYAKVKRRFLTEMCHKNIVVNADDEHGRQWIADLAATKTTYAYSTNGKIQGLPDSVAQIYAYDINLTLDGIIAKVSTPWGNGELQLPLIGLFNLSNALAVLTTLCIYGIPFDQVLTALSKLTPVPGRMQLVGGQADKPVVVVDYAHTPDALDKVLQALRAHTQGKLICVFGCGGDRDPGKRPQMAKIAEHWADRVTVTNDNPRHEKAEDIAAQILKGFKQPEKVFIELDRSKAIQNSIQCALRGDCVLVAGKGAERYQQIGDEKLPFDDLEHVQNSLGLRRT